MQLLEVSVILVGLFQSRGYEVDTVAPVNNSETSFHKTVVRYIGNL